MARRPRIHYPGAIYHAMARGVDGRDIFVEDRDRTYFLEGMRRIERETSAEVIAFCLMGNHFHLAIKVASVPLAFIMQRMLSGYCATFNHRHNRTGHLFQARYKAIICLDDRYLSGLIRYIHMNPVRAGLVTAPKDWPWSSFKPETDVADAAGDFDPWPKGAQEVDLMRYPSEMVDLEAIGLSAAKDSGIALGALRSGCRERTVVAARRLFVRDAVRTGYTLTAAAKWLNTTLSSASRYARENTAITEGLTP